MTSSTCKALQLSSAYVLVKTDESAKECFRNIAALNAREQKTSTVPSDGHLSPSHENTTSVLIQYYTRDAERKA